MLTKVFDFLRSILWYLVDFVYNLMDSLLQIIKQLNAFDIIDSLSNNTVFQSFFKGIMAIAVTLFALFIVWKFVNRVLDPDDEISIKAIIMEIIKCGTLIMLSTFLFSQVSTFSIKLANYTGNIFESSTNSSLSSSMLQMYVSYKNEYKKSDKFSETETIPQLVSSGKFSKNEVYLDKYVTKSRLILSDEKDYKYDINWLMALLCGGFFLYSLFFAGIMLGRRQIEFLFLFAIAPIVFATSVCNKQRRGAVIEQLVSLALQSAVVMMIVSITAMVMQQINETTFFTNTLLDIVIKSLLYLGCATFILTGSQVINRFIGSNVSAASGREQLMSLMGYGKMFGGAAAVGGATAIGGTLLAAGASVKGAKFAKNSALSTVGASLASYGMSDSPSGTQTRMQKMASATGMKMMTKGQMGFARNNDRQTPSASDTIMGMGANSINDAVRRVMPRNSYNPSYYRRNKMMR